MKTPLSVAIITLNEGSRLAACLDTVAFADEIIVVDSGSTDGTQSVAEKYGCRVIQQEWLGYGKQKQFAVDQAQHDWVLCLDADERVSPDLQQSINDLLSGKPALAAYESARCNYFMGRWLRHGEGYPDWSLRLFDRRLAMWSNDPVHEKVVTQSQVGRIAGDLLHESQESLAQYLDKQNRYTSLQAQQLYQRGKKASALKIVFSPVLRFIKMYLIRLGFLDGLPGFVHITIGCWNSAVKYAKLRELIATAKSSS